VCECVCFSLKAPFKFHLHHAVKARTNKSHYQYRGAAHSQCVCHRCKITSTLVRGAGERSPSLQGFTYSVSSAANSWSAGFTMGPSKWWCLLRAMRAAFKPSEWRPRHARFQPHAGRRKKETRTEPARRYKRASGISNKYPPYCLAST
jgi:hypothetical protein